MNDDTKLSNDVVEALGQQQNNEQLSAALATMAFRSALLRDAFLANGFTREEAIKMVSLWVQTIVSQRKTQ